MKATLFFLAAYQMTATIDDDKSHRYVDHNTKQAIEKIEGSVCGGATGAFGLVNDPVMVEVRPIAKCKTRIPDAPAQ